MTPIQGRSPAEWFREAARCHVAGHQACAACGAQHCVFRSEVGGRVQYSCSACGFSVCHETHTNSYIAANHDETEVEVGAAPPRVDGGSGDLRRGGCTTQRGEAFLSPLSSPRHRGSSNGNSS